MKNIPEPTRKAAVEPMRGNCAKRLSILEAAANVFCRQGFAGASIDEIAAEACVSRQTVYNHYREKETLFMAVVADVMDRANAQLYAILSTFPERTDNLEDDLVRFSISLSRNCICNREGRFLRRLVQNEGERYPHLFQSWREHGPGKIDAALGALLSRLAHKGALRIDDVDVAARQFLALANADLQMITLFGEKPTEAQFETAARNAVRCFLRAYGGEPESAEREAPARDYARTPAGIPA